MGLQINGLQINRTKELELRNENRSFYLALCPNDDNGQGLRFLTFTKSQPKASTSVMDNTKKLVVF